MKTIIAGSRIIQNYEWVKEAIKESKFDITEVVYGGANGVDKLGRKYAIENNIDFKPFIPDWNKHGKKAGILRNIEMGDYAEGLVAVWDGKSKGTSHMIDYAKKKGLKVYIKKIDSNYAVIWNVMNKAKVMIENELDMLIKNNYITMSYDVKIGKWNQILYIGCKPNLEKLRVELENERKRN